jgi:DNA-binding response OmpR family regulator
MRIQLVVDEPDAALALAKGRREQAYTVDVVADGPLTALLEYLAPRAGGAGDAPS